MQALTAKLETELLAKLESLVAKKLKRLKR